MLDGDDPYLVVAADKGTATFSDTANARERASTASGSGDAFATGGSAGLRPQGARHHRARRLGVGEAALPRARASTCCATRSPRRDRRHVGRRLRQRDAVHATRSSCVAAFDHRNVFLDPEPDAGRLVRRAPAAVPAARARRGTTTTARCCRPAATCSTGAAKAVVPSQGGARGARDPRRGADGDDARRADPVDPAGAGRPAVERRDRHLREVVARDATRTRATGRTTACASAGRRCVRGSSARAATSGSRSAGGSSTRWRAGGSTPTSSTTPPGVDTSDHEVNWKILLGLAIQRGELTLEGRNELLQECAPDVVAARPLRQLPAGADPLAGGGGLDPAHRGLRGPDGAARGRRRARA